MFRLLCLLTTGCFVSSAALEARVDADGDGFDNLEAGGDDCDDQNAATNPAADEIYYDGIDNDCDGIEDDQDQDGDGFPVSIDCDDTDPLFHPGADDAPYDGVDHDCAEDDDFDADGDGVYPPEYAALGAPTDCDDHHPLVFGVEVRCDGIDNDCDIASVDGTLIDGVLGDLDGDGYYACDDCIDLDPTIHPGAMETCNGIDDDCNGALDDGLFFQDYFPDGDEDGYGEQGSTSVLACEPPLQHVANDGDCDDNANEVHPTAVEACNGVDDDCDGHVDEGWTLFEVFADADGDGFGNPIRAIGLSCVVLPGQSALPTDCDDAAALVSPIAVELCDGVDNDCDELTDEGQFLDLDEDGFGGLATFDCAAGPIVQDGQDCDDHDEAIRPGVPDVCDGMDNDCDGTADNGFPLSTYYPDDDGDGVGSTAAGELLCAAREGMVTVDGDCDDHDITIRPGLPEVCDGKDNDCTGVADDGLEFLEWYADVDDDGFGQPGVPIISCQPFLAQSATNDRDCDDTSPFVHPLATEVCDNLDNNCSGMVDDGLVLTAFYGDADSDGYGAGSVVVESCATFINGLATTDDDCDDQDFLVHPGAPELCDAIDNNCDLQVDESFQILSWHPDADGDAHGNDDPSFTIESCDPPTGYVLNGDDCDDTRSDIFTGALESCADELDSDCDGTTDDPDAPDLRTFWFDFDFDGHGDPGGHSVIACAQPTRYAPDDDDCDVNNPAFWRGPMVGGLGYHDLGDSPTAIEIESAARESCEGVTLEFEGTVVLSTQVLTLSGPRHLTLRGRNDAVVQAVNRSTEYGATNLSLFVIGGCIGCSFENLHFRGSAQGGTTFAQVDVRDTEFGVSFRDLKVTDFKAWTAPGVFTNTETYLLTFERVEFSDLTLESLPSPLPSEYPETGFGVAISLRGNFNGRGTVNVIDSSFTRIISERDDANAGVIINRSGPYYLGPNHAYLANLTVERSVFVDNDVPAIDLTDVRGGSGGRTEVIDSLIYNTDNWAINTTGSQGDDALTLTRTTILRGTNGVLGHAGTTLSDSVVYTSGMEIVSSIGDNCLQSAVGPCTMGPVESTLFVDPSPDMVTGWPVDPTVVETEVPVSVNTPVGYLP